MTFKQFLSESLPNKNDARQLLCFVTGCSLTEILTHPDREIPQQQMNKLVTLSDKRKTGLPLAYVIEQRYFYKSIFYCPQGVLIPQPDTEILVEKAISKALEFKDKSLIKILDLCAGTGCIGISVAKELSSYFEEVELTLSDISQTAFEVFSENVRQLITEKNISVKRNLGNLFENIDDRFHLILTNPPYIKTSVIPSLESEVQAEPLLALDGGETGLELITKILESAENFSLPDALLFMEIGYNQGSEVKKLFENNSLTSVEIIKDLSRNDRVVKGSF